MKNIEIERKWLLSAFPDLPVLEEVRMEQGYLAFEPNTVRIRKEESGGRVLFFLTIKSGGTLARTEVEMEISADQYATLRGILAAPVAQKLFRTYALPGGQVLECSLVDEGDAESFYYAEVEFDSEEEAHRFVPPPFLGRELTQEPGWSMASYCARKARQQGRPPPDKAR